MKKLYPFFLIFTFAMLVSACGSDKDTPRQQSFDDGWLFYRGELTDAQRPDFDDSAWRQVNLPHDWSIEDIPGTDSPFAADAVTEVSGGFTVGGEGWYRKHFKVAKADACKRVFVNFDGIYRNADVWVNGRHVAFHAYGYTPFELDITDFINPGQDNVMAVRVKNEGMNCRWYTGSGIYRHTLIKTLDPVHFKTWETFVTTPVVNDSEAVVDVQCTLANSDKTTGKITLETIILAPDNKTVAHLSQPVSLDGRDSISVSGRLRLDDPLLWSPDAPNLYTVVNRLDRDGKTLDRDTISIGLRNISFSAEKGFQLNGKTMKLKGGCIHHDHGLLGAKAFDRAEQRKVELLKAAGFNALRLSHNPPSTALLEACDRLGMMVIDEAFDMWIKGHYPGDYSEQFNDCWQQDLRAMVTRDRNHPSVIMWSIGNEIKNKETAEVVDVCRRLTAFVKTLDTTRPVTAGVNSIVDETDDFLNTLDVCGYNYCLGRYETDAKRHPERVIYASESYASQIYDYWQGVVQHPWVIGDFVWTAYDYIGEASIGWCGYPLDPRIFPWNHAYCGDIDLMGERRPQSLLRESVWSENPVNHIVVTPPTPSFPLNPDKADWSVWDFPDRVTHWNFPGHEGQELSVTIYTNGDEAELFLNDKSLGSQVNSPEKKNELTWRVPYAPGTLRAVSRHGNSAPVTSTLTTAGKVEKIILTPDRATIAADGNDLSFITLELVDNNGIRNPLAEEMVEFSIDGDATIEAVGNANPMSTESFTAPRRKTWRGSNLLVIRAGRRPGPVTVTARVNGLPTATTTVNQKI